MARSYAMVVSVGLTVVGILGFAMGQLHYSASLFVSPINY
jgi:hypothetical protein